MASQSRSSGNSSTLLTHGIERHLLSTADGEFMTTGQCIQAQEIARRVQATSRWSLIVPSLIQNLCEGNCRRFWLGAGYVLKDGQLTKQNFWKTPAAWRAVVKDGKIAVWQVYADNELSARS
jgi:hypothetical protein